MGFNLGALAPTADLGLQYLAQSGLQDARLQAEKDKEDRVQAFQSGQTDKTIQAQKDLQAGAIAAQTTLHTQAIDEARKLAVGKGELTVNADGTYTMGPLATAETAFKNAYAEALPNRWNGGSKEEALKEKETQDALKTSLPLYMIPDPQGSGKLVPDPVAFPAFQSLVTEYLDSDAKPSARQAVSMANTTIASLRATADQLAAKAGVPGGPKAQAAYISKFLGDQQTHAGDASGADVPGIPAPETPGIVAPKMSAPKIVAPVTPPTPDTPTGVGPLVNGMRVPALAGQNTVFNGMSIPGLR